MIAVFLLLPLTGAHGFPHGYLGCPSRAENLVHARTMSFPMPSRRGVQALAAALLVAAALTGAARSAGATTTLPPRTVWSWPVPSPHPIIRPFIAPETPYSRGHRGIDIAAPEGDVVRSPASGIVHFSGFVVDRNLISIDHGGGLISSFEPVLSVLAEGAVVRRGDPLGTLQSGHCRVPCLHLGVRLHGQYVSPLNYLGGIERSVLLPTRVIR